MSEQRENSPMSEQRENSPMSEQREDSPMSEQREDSPMSTPFIEPGSIVHPLSRILPKNPVGPMRAPARALGWFSVVLGMTKLLLPRAVSHAVGMKGRGAGLLRFHGLREIGVGIGLLNSKDPTPWLWGRVAGDALDVATVASGLVGGRPVRTLAALAVLGTVATVDARCAEAAGRGPRRAVRDYSARSGFSKPAAEMRGAARADAPG